MRFLVTALLWLITTAALAVAVPSVWAWQHIVDVDGYAALAQSAAQDPQLRDAMAAELTTQVVELADVDGKQVRAAAAAYTASSAFPQQFSQVNRIAHRWVFTDSVTQTGNQWQLDLEPILSDSSFQQLLDSYGVEVPTRVTVPVTVTDDLRPGQLQRVGMWGPWLSVGVAVLAVAAALLTLWSAKRRGKALAALGISALLVGAAGWAATEVARAYVDAALADATADVASIAGVMVRHAEDSLHHWLNMTLAAGAGLVVLGVIVGMLGSILRSR